MSVLNRLQITCCLLMHFGFSRLTTGISEKKTEVNSGNKTQKLLKTEDDDVLSLKL